MSEGQLERQPAWWRRWVASWPSRAEDPRGAAQSQRRCSPCASSVPPPPFFILSRSAENLKTKLFEHLCRDERSKPCIKLGIIVESPQVMSVELGKKTCTRDVYSSVLLCVLVFMILYTLPTLDVVVLMATTSFSSTIRYSRAIFFSVSERRLDRRGAK